MLQWWEMRLKITDINIYAQAVLPENERSELE